MKPFNLETVLKHRKRTKELAMNRFHQAQNRLNAVKKELEEKRLEYQCLTQRMSTLESQGISVEVHIRYQHRVEFITETIIGLEKKLKKHNEIVIREQKHLLKKSKEQKVMQKLKEKQNAEYQSFINKKESAILDEMAILHRNNH